VKKAVKKWMGSIPTECDLHTVPLPDSLKAELLSVFKPDRGETVLDAEWLRYHGRIYVFDVLHLVGASLERKSYRERYDLLKRVAFTAPNILLLPLFETAQQCLDYISKPDETIEGLVFKAWGTPGWPDTAIIRCRKVA